MDGFVLIDKPRGWSSFDVIRKLRRTTGVRKMGHAGTLDPLATGLLIVLVGKATKLQDRFMKQDKLYEAEITLGASSTTDDAEGEISSWEPSHVPSREQVDKALSRFQGEISQKPPQHSAIKIDGQRAYKLARNGEKVEIKPRNVKIYEIDNLSYEYPELHLRVYVSSGTYIRSLARDVGESLGTGGYLSALRRTRIGEYSVEDAVSAEAPLSVITAQIVDAV